MTNRLDFYSEFYLSEVLILDCLRSDELQTARSTYNFLLDLKNIDPGKIAENVNRLEINLEKITTRDEFLARLEKLLSIVNSHWNGIVHIECHGDGQLIEIGDAHEKITHEELFAIFRKINEKSKCGLGIIFACCNGLGPYNIRDFHIPSPFYFCLSYIGAISAGTLEDNMAKFYKNLFKTKKVLPPIEHSNFILQRVEEIYLNALYLVVRALCSSHERNSLRERMITAIANKYNGINKIKPYLRQEIRKQARKLSSLSDQCDRIIADSETFLCGRKLNVSKTKLLEWLTHDK